MTSDETSGQARHRPVVLDEVIAALAPHAGGLYLDATFGGGGHTSAILNASEPDGRVFAIDADPAAIERGQKLRDSKDLGPRLTLSHGNFVDLAAMVGEAGASSFDGALMDLGLSSFQLDDAERGFAFRFDGPLDMRFDPTRGSPASDLVNHLDSEDLATILWKFGDEHRSRRIASAIVRERERAPIETTTRLASIVERAVGGRKGSETHPATRSFQALRIAVNDELASLERALNDLVDLLKPGGRLAVISFHSLEDRIVKQFMRLESSTCICPPEQPVCTCDHQPRLRSGSRAIRPTSVEIARNPRSRSAVLRVAERL
jgi:16S rRNA (cytosine1402-N4)-methyltransferase